MYVNTTGHSNDRWKESLNISKKKKQRMWSFVAKPEKQVSHLPTEFSHSFSSVPKDPIHHHPFPSPPTTLHEFLLPAQADISCSRAGHTSQKNRQANSGWDSLLNQVTQASRTPHSPPTYKPPPLSLCCPLTLVLISSPSHHWVPAPNVGRDPLLNQRPHQPPEVHPQLMLRTPTQS